MPIQIFIKTVFGCNKIEMSTKITVRFKVTLKKGFGLWQYSKRQLARLCNSFYRTTKSVVL